MEHFSLCQITLAVADRRLRELVLGDLVCDVGSGERRALAAEDLFDDIGKDANVAVLNLNALDHTDSAGIAANVTLELLADTGDELEDVQMSV